MQINRLFEIIYILLNKGGSTAKELAERFEVSTRTIYRDVETLSGGNIPVYMTKGKGGGVFLDKNFVLNKAVLTDSEKSEILSGMQALTAVNPDNVDSTVKKISALFGTNNNNWVEVDFVSWQNSAQEKELFNNIKNAVINRNVITFDYRTGEKEVLERTIEPLKLCFKGQSWYLYGYCRLRKDFRFFKLSRIKKMIILAEKFDRDSPKNIFADKSFGDKYIKITLKISAKMSYRVYDEFENYIIDPNGDFIVDVDMPIGDWIYPYIATYGENAEVLAPIEIRTEIKNKINNILKNYL